MRTDFDFASCSHAETIGKYISAIYRHMQVLIAERLEPYRIGSGQYIFLLTLAQKEGVSQKELAEALLIDKTTTAKALAKLEAEGYLRREVCAKDQRYNLLFLTEKGKEVVPKVREVLNEMNRYNAAEMTNEEYEQMLTLLSKLLHNVSKQISKGDSK